MLKLHKKIYPICFLSKHTLAIFEYGIFKSLNMDTGEKSEIIKVKLPFKKRLLNRIPFYSRIFRKNIRCGCKISNNIILYVIGREIYELDIINKKISTGFCTIDKSRPLIFSEIKNIDGFDDGIYFGGYKSNLDKNPISIYKRIGIDKWIDVFQFPKGSIEHIHNIIPDPHKNLIYIFTGDFDQSAGIWIAENNFKSVTPILTGHQKYRGCVGFSTPSGLIYATDSPFSSNTIRLLKNIGKKWESIELQTINGPSIYGCQWNENFVFSTSVEGDGRTQSLFYKLFGRRRGLGIISDFSYIYKGNLDEGFKIIYKVKKDMLPFFLFQFGVLIFPSGKNKSKYLPIYHIATNKYSMSTLVLSE